MALGANVADFLGDDKPVAIIDEFEVQGDQLESFLNLHDTVVTQGWNKSSEFIK